MTGVPPSQPPPHERTTRNVSNAASSKPSTQAALRRNLNKVLLDHWSFLIGEIVLESCIIRVLTRIYLTLSFDVTAGKTRW
ncbi:hypothetical protein [Frankia sp. Cas8]|uniref:hypothetical protein n=1 Tax=unclassified Frankia TaxID=2632575 RepID=UPI003A0FC6B9